MTPGQISFPLSVLLRIYTVRKSSKNRPLGQAARFHLAPTRAALNYCWPDPRSAM
jgi:hypothetical protein